MKERQFMTTPTCLEMNILVSLDKIKKKTKLRTLISAGVCAQHGIPF